jgi:hypothetical protein
MKLNAKNQGYGRCIPRFYCRSHFICLNCRHTISGVKKGYNPLCPKGCGKMIQYDDRLRVPRKNKKNRWKQFWSITVIQKEE